MYFKNKETRKLSKKKEKKKHSHIELYWDLYVVPLKKKVIRKFYMQHNIDAYHTFI